MSDVLNLYVYCFPTVPSAFIPQEPPKLNSLRLPYRTSFFVGNIIRTEFCINIYRFFLVTDLFVFFIEAQNQFILLFNTS